MANKKFLSFRTKPRSPQKTVKWLEYFSQLEGQNYMKKEINNGESIFPVRRTYVKLAHPEIDLKEAADPESNARQEKAIYELLGFGYIDEDGKINITKAGKEILKNEGKRDEIMLRQLLKYQFPNYVNSNDSRKKYNEMNVFLMEIVLKMLDELNYLTRYEAAVALMFCCERGKIGQAIEIVKEWRDEKEQLRNLDKDIMEDLFKRITDKHYPDIDINEISSHLTTMDALFRFLEYTSLFVQSGRGDFTKISFREMARNKLNLLLDEYEFEFNNKWDSLDFFDEFGDPYSKELPWDKGEKLYNIILENLKEIKSKVIEYIDVSNDKYLEEIDKLIDKCKQNRDNKEILKNIEDEVRKLTISINEDIFIDITSTQDKERKKIISRLEDILNERETEISLALWFENITWKSLIGINGTHNVKRNFKVEPDLSPRFFAPGTGNTPDMEYYSKDFILIPEVSLTSGVVQWKNEGGSVVDHINSYIEVKNSNDEQVKGEVVSGDERDIMGLFLARKIDERVFWLFYALNNNSWMGEPIPIIPLKLEKYIMIIKKMYEGNHNSSYFEKFLYTLHKEAKASDDYKEWEKSINSKIDKFITSPEEYVKYNY